MTCRQNRLEFVIEVKKILPEIENLLCVTFKKITGLPSEYLLLRNSIS